MTLTSKQISLGFLLAGLMNFSVLVFSKLFTNTTIAKFDPDVMSNFGLLMIVLWGIGYIAVSKSYASVKWLILVFALEKLIYGLNWFFWLIDNSLSDVFSEDTLAGMFYSVYGVNDWMFCLFFFYVFSKVFKN
ncbi:hypothetical protein Q2T40_11905 [Winogradskyella maritima]|uniref:Uncharacterized protein n=1 Tax=Winogradskyella maritima TaxID=1517766 RepID=A0ABV8AKQ5_9FLAO|nr:hypothetical protein [Winogradskyella maritima]